MSFSKDTTPSILDQKLSGKKCSEKVFFFVRHGEREDHIKMESNWRDTPTPDQSNSKYESYGEEKNTLLTDMGRYQGFKSGKYLSDYISKLDQITPNPDNEKLSVLILSSPYRRCMDTAQHLVEALKFNDVNIHNDKIYLTSWIKEVQRENSKMSYNDLSKEAHNWILQNYRMAKSGVSFEHSLEQETGIDPNSVNEESISDSYERAKQFMDVQANMSSNDDKDLLTNNNLKLLAGYKGKYVICLTHAFFQKRIEILSGQMMMGHQRIHYCAITELTCEKRDPEDIAKRDDTKKISWGLKNYKLNIGMKYYKDHIYKKSVNSVNLKLESNVKSKDLENSETKLEQNYKPKL